MTGSLVSWLITAQGGCKKKKKITTTNACTKSSAHVRCVLGSAPRTRSTMCWVGICSSLWVSRDQSGTSQRRNVFTPLAKQTLQTKTKTRVAAFSRIWLNPIRHTDSGICDDACTFSMLYMDQLCLDIKKKWPKKNTKNVYVRNHYSTLEVESAYKKKIEACCASGSHFKGEARSSKVPWSGAGCSTQNRKVFQDT